MTNVTCAWRRLMWQLPLAGKKDEGWGGRQGIRINSAAATALTKERVYQVNMVTRLWEKSARYFPNKKKHISPIDLHSHSIFTPPPYIEVRDVTFAIWNNLEFWYSPSLKRNSLISQLENRTFNSRPLLNEFWCSILASERRAPTSSWINFPFDETIRESYLLAKQWLTSNYPKQSFEMDVSRVTYALPSQMTTTTTACMKL